MEVPMLSSVQNTTLEQNYARLQELIYSGGEHLSFSAVKTYLLCPRQHYYKYVRLETPQHLTDHLLFGSAIHKAVSGYYAQLKETGEQLHVDTLMSDFDAIFDGACSQARYPVLWSKRKEEWLERGKLMLSVFAETVKPNRIIAIELPFSVELHDPRTGEALPNLVGSIDLLEQDDDGKLVVGELKTAGASWSEDEVGYNIQASLYAFVLCELGLVAEGDDVQVRVDVLTKTKSPKLQQCPTVRRPWDRQRVQRLVAEVYRAVQAKVFFVNPSWMCGTCQYRKVCDAEP